jgi:hypothetical protein
MIFLYQVVEPTYIFMAFVPHMSISATEGLGSRALKERRIFTLQRRWLEIYITKFFFSEESGLQS